jgi:alkylation response protein AidB-like acyl-CoA dehydrogenase
MTARGVTILDNWNAMGMRGSGSNSVDIVDVFVPDDNILSPQRAAGGRSEVRRPQPALTNGSPSTPEGVRRAHRIPGLMIALPVIASCYLGIAAGVRDRAMRQVGLGRKARDPATARLAGLMTAHYRAAQWAMDGLIGETRDDTLASEQQFITTMIGKREVVLRSIAVVETAMEMLGAMTYARSQPYEQALRDIRAGITHPLAPEATLSEVGQTVLARVGRQAGREAGSRPTRAAPEQVARQETSGA